VIRPATDADAHALAELEVRAWRWAYVDFVDEEDMITVEDRVARWTGQEGVLVAEVEDRIAGVVQAAAGELRALYVEPAAQGAGLGATLLERGCDWLRAAGSSDAVLWVFEGNGHARGFFERRGWVADADGEGARGEAAGAPTLRYRQNLGA
jgi:GNAT superfamily N-acetyltransferase